MPHLHSICRHIGFSGNCSLRSFCRCQYTICLLRVDVVEIHINFLLGQVCSGKSLRVISQLVDKSLNDGILLTLESSGMSFHNFIFFGTCYHEHILGGSLVRNTHSGNITVGDVVTHTHNGGNKCRTRCNKVTSWFSDDLHSRRRREQFIEHGAHGLSNLIKVHVFTFIVTQGASIIAFFFLNLLELLSFLFIIILVFFFLIITFCFAQLFTNGWDGFQFSYLPSVCRNGIGITLLSGGVSKCLGRIPQTMRLSRKSPTNIQNLHIKPKVPLGHFKQLLTILQCHLIPSSITTATPHMERHTHNIQSKLLRLRQQDGPMLLGRTKLG
mmetsp:Transcript_22474/g.35281  ORF Transcript_22474/g.35281 Transcript_22474/m.35281 type:complete len:327 (+) Transcript_22474:2304-3284(+)